MPATRTRPASDLSFEALAELFNRGYGGYYVPVTLGETAFREMVEFQDIDLGGSRVIETEAGPVAFALLAIRGARGWIGGLGVAPEARGRGLGRDAMQAVLGVARERRLEHVDLEVLVQNAPAIPLYERLGFQDTRELGVWVREAGGDAERDTEFARDAAQAADCEVRAMSPSECLERFDAMRRARSPWQRERPVLERARDTLGALAAYEEGTLRAWAIYRAQERQLRIHDLARAERASEACLDACVAACLEAHPGSTATVLNMPPDTSESRALERAGFVTRWRQREMRLTL